MSSAIRNELSTLQYAREGATGDCIDTDRFAKTLVDSGPFNAAAVNISSTDATLDPISRGLYIGVSGDVKVDMAGTGTAITFAAVPVGYFPGRFSKVYRTGTTATTIIAVW